MKIFHHNDMDGYGAAAIVVIEWLKKNGVDTVDEYQKIINNCCVELDHGPGDKDKLLDVELGEEVYVVDYSFTQATAYLLDKLIDNTRLVWIDHHVSSIKLIEKRHVYSEVKGLVRNGISGTALTYIYFNMCKMEDTPRFVQLISDYDCWINKMLPDSTYFKLGYDAQSDKFLTLYLLYHRPPDPLMKNIIDNGYIIKNYIDQDNKQYIEEFGYESKTEDGILIYVCNKSSNSWLFGDLINKYAAVCCYVFNGEDYKYSLFSSDYSTFDCRLYAESHGGGGHEHAAGFISKDMMFRKNK